MWSWLQTPLRNGSKEPSHRKTLFIQPVQQSWAKTQLAVFVSEIDVIFWAEKHAQHWNNSFEATSPEKLYSVGISLLLHALPGCKALVIVTSFINRFFLFSQYVHLISSPFPISFHLATFVSVRRIGLCLWVLQWVNISTVFYLCVSHWVA